MKIKSYLSKIIAEQLLFDNAPKEKVADYYDSILSDAVSFDLSQHEFVTDIKQVKQVKAGKHFKFVIGYDNNVKVINKFHS